MGGGWSPVMAGLVPAIHGFTARTKNVNARHTPGHGELSDTARV